MKRYIVSSKYTQDENVVLDDKLVMDIEVDFPYQIVSSSDSINQFPGVEQFRQDVLKLLEDKFKFEVIEDVYDGVKQKGHITNRTDSVSIYFDSYFDLSNAQQVLDEAGIRSIAAPESGKVYCFIHLRFSDHELNDEGDQLHRKFLKDNASKYSSDIKVTHVIKEESIDVKEAVLHRYYKQALLDLEYELGVRISMWVRKIDAYRKSGI